MTRKDGTLKVQVKAKNVYAVEYSYYFGNFKLLYDGVVRESKLLIRLVPLTSSTQPLLNYLEKQNSLALHFDNAGTVGLLQALPFPSRQIGWPRSSR